MFTFRLGINTIQYTYIFSTTYLKTLQIESPILSADRYWRPWHAAQPVFVDKRARARSAILER